MLSDLSLNITEASRTIDHMVTRYFANRLGVKDNSTINALGKDGKLTFNQKIELFCDIIPLSKIDKSKFKVFTKIHNEILLHQESPEMDSLDFFNCYTPFLVNTYLEDKDLQTFNEKLELSIYTLIEDLKQIAEYHLTKPPIFYNKKVGIVLPE